MNSTRISPVRISTISVPACPTVTNCEAIVSLTRSIRSATAPANGEITTEGARLQKAITLTHSAECVSSQASQSVATRCIHDPVQQVTLPA
jgi:hypothetical protein